MNKKILIINTGGTISSVPTDKGFSPANGVVESALNKISALQADEMPAYDIYEFEPLLDSSNMTVNDWNVLAQRIAKEYDNYDGFLVFHGTDTMAYTASALSFMLENLAKPVILTGSQIPLYQVRNDAYDNILTSLWLCAHRPLPEVCIYFNEKLLRGNRAKKASSSRYDAFDSPNFPYLASIGTQISLRQDLVLPAPKAAFEVHPMKANFIANVRLFPGFSTEILRLLLENPVKGLVLETYGSGNAQNNKEWIDALNKARDREVIIVNCTQCYHGTVDMQCYATGNALVSAGVVSGYDMTLEAAHCKLMHLLSLELSLEERKARLQESAVGELSK